MPSSLMNLPKKFALYVGNAYPHKNLEFLIKSWESIDLPLVLAGGRSVFYDRLSKLIKSPNIILVGHIEDPTVLYKKAEIFVFPTLMEGFGLPPLEAMKHGLPVVASDIPVLHEVLGDAAVFFDPKSPTSLKEKLAYTKAHLTTQRAKGYDQVKKYSWEKMARETIAVYESCAGL